jgi:hypothetical protein
MAVEINLNNVQAQSVVISANETAVNDGIYHVVANATFTDPTPVEGKGFKVFVRNGTATIGGTAYVAGSYVLRVYHSGAWLNKNLDPASISSGITIGTTAITGGTDGRVLFQAGGVVQQDSLLFWDNTNKRLGVGATPSSSVRLDVRAQGALSTDIVQRWRNSADSADLAYIAGNGWFEIGNVSGLIYGGVVNGVAELSGTTSARLRGFSTDDRSIFISSSNIWIRHEEVKHQIGGSSVLWKSKYNGNNSVFELIESTKQSNILVVGNGTGLVSNPTYADAFQMYSADIVAGNAAPHFRTENGSIIKLYQETTGVAAATLVSGGGTTLTDTDTFDGYTLKQIVKALRNNGLLA